MAGKHLHGPYPGGRAGGRVSPQLLPGPGRHRLLGRRAPLAMAPAACSSGADCPQTDRLTAPKLRGEGRGEEKTRRERERGSGAREGEGNEEAGGDRGHPVGEVGGWVPRSGDDAQRG